MYNTAFRITGNTASAEDVLQESFLSAFQSLDTYREDASFGHWLKKIVVNKAITVMRKESRLELRENDDDLDMPEPHDHPGEDMDFEVNRIRQAMEQLPDGFRTVLSLYLLEGYDHKEIGEILNITESTSKSQYKRAKDKLRALLEKEVYYG
jgi:RNA polymerase sigma factor (sigma-70 family)